MTARDVSVSTLWAVIDRPYSWITLNSTKSRCLKVGHMRKITALLARMHDGRLRPRGAIAGPGLSEAPGLRDFFLSGWRATALSRSR